MKLGALYNYIIKKGMEKDPRSRAAIRKTLLETRKEYDKLPRSLKSMFDKDRLRHPYDDTRILNGSDDVEVKTVIVGIDMEVAELVLADRLNENGRGIDLVMAHHPEGRALAGFYRVMGMQVDILEKFGIDRSVGRDFLKERMSEVSRAISAVNHMRSVDAAKLLGLPFMCAHTPADNHVTTFLQNLFNSKRPKTLKNTMEILRSIPEYKSASGRNAGPFILLGKEKDKAGKIAVDMTGGTEGSRRIFSRLSQAGVGTIIGMHFSEKHYESAQKEHINIIVAGHMSSDSLGLNLLLDQICKIDRLDIISCSGFERIRRG